MNTMVLGGLGAGVFAIDRQLRGRAGEHLPASGNGRSSRKWPRRRAANEVALAVLAATLATAIVFFPVMFLYGVSRFLFVALAPAVVFSLFASYFVAMTVVPLYCAKLMHKHEAMKNSKGDATSVLGRVVKRFNGVGSTKMLASYDKSLARSLMRPITTVVGLAGASLLVLFTLPVSGCRLFPAN